MIDNNEWPVAFLTTIEECDKLVKDLRVRVVRSDAFGSEKYKDKNKGTGTTLHVWWEGCPVKGGKTMELEEARLIDTANPGSRAASLVREMAGIKKFVERSVP